ncbi:GGDEF domain-containing protein [Thiomicrospira microaerophila]|uniref:GGDEF domain-containing protein n=1 Tax=Thiomicrospira microaerophila TaxID=406020 RepID=UPI0005CA55EA|nr:GGDEF domain-containing protein [Thiomicrospira microaerophila]
MKTQKMDQQLDRLTAKSDDLVSIYLADLYIEENNRVLDQFQSMLFELVPSAVADFYDHLMLNEAVHFFLSQDQVANRLKDTLGDWLRLTLSSKNKPEEVDTFIAYQVKIGEIHARIDVPLSFVHFGMMILKRHFYRGVLMTDVDIQDKLALIEVIDKLFMACLTVMDESYVTKHSINERVTQEYISQLSGKDIALEVERIKSDLLGWYNRLVRAVVFKAKPQQSIFSSEFGLWVGHKLAMMVANKAQVAQISKLTASIDSLSTELLTASHTEVLLEQIDERIKELVYLLSIIVDESVFISQQRDSLTKLIERRFMSPIMQREVRMAITTKLPLSVLMIDIDDFKQVNDVHGHAAGDKVLEVVGHLIRSKLRLVDYAFRYGGEELMVALPELGINKAVEFAQQICNLVANEVIELENQRRIKVTVSIGAAAFNGSPDYMHTVENADKKLYEAKRTGKNRVCF